MYSRTPVAANEGGSAKLATADPKRASGVGLYQPQSTLGNRGFANLMGPGRLPERPKSGVIGIFQRMKAGLAARLQPRVTEPVSNFGEGGGQPSYGNVTQPPAVPVAHLRASSAPAPNRTGLPDGLKSGIESLSGISMDNVTVHYNSSQPARLNALAYARGRDIHVAPGKERHLAHEAWHVVQQAQGRVNPTMQMKDGVSVNDDEGLEHEADVMSARAAVAGHLAAPSGSFQGRPEPAGHIGRRQVLQLPAKHDVIQPWLDQNGKFHMGAVPPDWESFVDKPTGLTRWRPKEGTPAAEEAKEKELKAKEKGKEKADKAKAAATELASKWEDSSEDYVKVFTEDPANILYTQDSIASHFTDGAAIQSLADALAAEKVKPGDVEPIVVQLYNGRLYSYDNRRLWAFKRANKEVRCRFASPREIENNKSKLTGDGRKIVIRP